VQELQNRFFNISHRLLEVFSKIKFTINEAAGLRLEAILSGELNIPANGEKIKFRSGEYRLTDVPLFTALFKQNTSCSIFITHFSLELLQQLEIDIEPCAPRRMPDTMANTINEMLRNPYSNELRNFYYENCVRELLFFHLAQSTSPLPGQLMNTDIASIYKADALMASNLQQHFTIDELARMVNSNSFKLKTGFSKVYGMGVFKRLIFRRMEHAKLLLSTTDKSIGEIASLAGYDTVAGFIHAFRREFGVTPRQWRNQERHEDDETNGEETFTN
jgi:AraC-like DNA-binding protein